MKNKHIGSSIVEFLKTNSMFSETLLLAWARVSNWQMHVDENDIEESFERIIRVWKEAESSNSVSAEKRLSFASKETTKISPFDIAEYLESDEEIQGFLDEVGQTGDASDFEHAQKTADRAKELNKIKRIIKPIE